MKLYKQLHLVLPGPTQVLVTLSVLITDWWWLLLLMTAGAIIFSKTIMKKPYFIARWDAFKLNMPIFAELNRMIVVSQFIRTFAILVSAGVPLIKSLEVASLVVHNSKVTEIATALSVK